MVDQISMNVRCRVIHGEEIVLENINEDKVVRDLLSLLQEKNEMVKNAPHVRFIFSGRVMVHETLADIKYTQDRYILVHAMKEVPVKPPPEPVPEEPVVEIAPEISPSTPSRRPESNDIPFPQASPNPAPAPARVAPASECALPGVKELMEFTGFSERRVSAALIIADMDVDAAFTLLEASVFQPGSEISNIVMQKPQLLATALEKLGVPELIGQQELLLDLLDLDRSVLNGQQLIPVSSRSPRPLAPTQPSQSSYAQQTISNQDKAVLARIASLGIAELDLVVEVYLQMNKDEEATIRCLLNLKE